MILYPDQAEAVEVEETLEQTGLIKFSPDRFNALTVKEAVERDTTGKTIAIVHHNHARLFNGTPRRSTK